MAPSRGICYRHRSTIPDVPVEHKETVGLRTATRGTGERRSGWGGLASLTVRATAPRSAAPSFLTTGSNLTLLRVDAEAPREDFLTSQCRRA